MGGTGLVGVPFHDDRVNEGAEMIVAKDMGQLGDSLLDEGDALGLQATLVYGKVHYSLGHDKQQGSGVL